MGNFQNPWFKKKSNLFPKWVYSLYPSPHKCNVLQTLQILPAVSRKKQHNLTRKKYLHYSSITMFLYWQFSMEIMSLHNNMNKQFNFNLTLPTLTCDFLVSRTFICLIYWILSYFRFSSSLHYWFHQVWNKISKRNLP